MYRLCIYVKGNEVDKCRSFSLFLACTFYPQEIKKQSMIMLA
jgi:hypothetical protein